MPIPICPFLRNPTGAIWPPKSEDRRGISGPFHCERIVTRPTDGSSLPTAASPSAGSACVLNADTPPAHQSSAAYAPPDRPRSQCVERLLDLCCQTKTWWRTELLPAITCKRGNVLPGHQVYVCHQVYVSPGL
jgi:hypothetical protein